MKSLISIGILFGLIFTIYGSLTTVSEATSSKKFPDSFFEHPDMRKQLYLEIIQNKEYMIEFNKTWEECQCVASINYDNMILPDKKG